ncbi:MAG: glycosyltransferase family 39 protein [Moorea sp. SIO4E2]|uniref:ArnT family glycosyltransferase n=1 Tax=Moorena sp. SIO4E2 TaxID=2607826 RepID=UPI0013BADC13|nr:glycosyltransferase family 39 protein [Moorena sp. SIO4E2]NEQ08794.1 glycosyltransferase family 39 protein [Moorena sp. SIO4E2]
MNKLALTLKNPSLTDIKWILSLFLAALFLWGIFLGNVPLRDWDEGTRALIAREIYRTGNWLHPTLWGEPYLLKPPLMDWLIALSYKVGGVQEFTTRLPGAFLSACGVPLLYLVARELFLQRLSAIFAASVYLTLLPVVRHGRLAMLDGMINTWFLLLLFCLLKACQAQSYWAIGIGVCLGLITFTKGLLVVPLGAIALVFILANKTLGLLKSRYFWLGIVLGYAPVLVWYIAQWQHYGATFWHVHFLSQGFARISEKVEGNQGSAWYYLLELIKYTFPWLLFWLGGFYLAWRKPLTSWGSLILIGTIGYLTIISMMATKLPWYIMPVYPFFAIAVAAKLTVFWQHWSRYPKILTIILGFIGVAALGGCIYFILADPQPVLILMGMVVSLTMTLAAWTIKQHNRNFIPILLIGMYITLVLLMSSHSWLWELNEAFPVKPVAALIQENTAPGDIIYTSFSYQRPSLDFYSDRKVIPQDENTLKQLCSTQSYLLLDNSTLAALQLPNQVFLGTAEGFTLARGVGVGSGE